MVNMMSKRRTCAHTCEPCLALALDIHTGKKTPYTGSPSAVRTSTVRPVVNRVYTRRGMFLFTFAGKSQLGPPRPATGVAVSICIPPPPTFECSTRTVSLYSQLFRGHTHVLGAM